MVSIKSKDILLIHVNIVFVNLQEDVSTLTKKNEIIFSKWLFSYILLSPVVWPPFQKFSSQYYVSF